MLATLTSTSAVADDPSAASEHMLQAEMALQNDEYLKAAIEYRKAAELSSSVEVARKATRIGFTYKFNDEALLAAKRWIKLDKDSDEARLYLAQLYFRVDDLRNSKRQFERLIKTGQQPPGDRLLSLVSYLGEEGMAKRADKLRARREADEAERREDMYQRHQRDMLLDDDGEHWDRARY